MAAQKSLRSQDEEYISQLKIILDEVQMSIYDFKKMYKMKNESNISTIKQILWQKQESDLKGPLKKLFEGLKVWYRD